VASSPTIVGIGEILWDLLPSGRQLGGAPANFAYCSHLLGSRGVVVSRVGNDELGFEARTRLHQAGIAEDFIATDTAHPTGTVQIEISPAGQPTFKFTHSVAWDFLKWNEELGDLASSAEAVCFGTLAQRSEVSRKTILKFIDSTKTTSVKIFDVNLRQSFYSDEIIADSIRRTTVLKLNDQELPLLANVLAIDQRNFARTIIERLGVKLVCITRGQNGSILVDNANTHAHPGFRVQVKDAVGAGDAFTAGLVHEFLRGSSLAAMNDTANRIGAWVASCEGAMPQPPKEGLAAAIAHLKRAQSPYIKGI